MKGCDVRFIIYAPSFNEDSGGVIVLHKLVYLLNKLGELAYICPDRVGTRTNLWKRVRNKIFPKEFYSPNEFDISLINKAQITENDIVIYPEVVDGNPLKAKNTVRWLLHKPGFHTGRVNFCSNELIFVFDEYAVEPGFNIDPLNVLFVLSLHSSYRYPEQEIRSGSCYMMRKGIDRQITHDLTNSISLDGLAHDEIAEVFKKSEAFYCYDEFTMYSQFAALCGCLSIVQPMSFSSREEWVAKHPISKYGIAYGEDDISHARKTMHKVQEYFDQLEDDSITTVRSFIKKAKSHFNLES